MPLLKQILFAIIYAGFILIISLSANIFFPRLFDPLHLIFPIASFWLITSIALALFSLGERKSPEEQPMFSLAAIGGKFLLSALLALIYFGVLKIEGLRYILLFFMLYLAFTVYLIRVIIKTLKVRSLKNGKI